MVFERQICQLHKYIGLSNKYLYYEFNIINSFLIVLEIYYYTYIFNYMLKIYCSDLGSDLN
jgi:hypothetical protein